MPTLTRILDQLALTPPNTSNGPFGSSSSSSKKVDDDDDGRKGNISFPFPMTLTTAATTSRRRRRRNQH